ERIAKPLRASGVFPPVVIHMISVGEESGRLGQMLGRIAESYEKQTKRALKAATSTLEPLIIVCLAGVVTLIILAMLLPMLDMNMMMQ
ncbi:type II secretion system F family protein, partial [bacterium]|nr:type II secretion system F family protein [bacterium]